MSVPKPIGAAWVPLRDATPYWTYEAGLAVEWITERAAIEGKAPLLITSNLVELSAPALRDAGFERISVLEPPDPLPTGRPVLAHLPLLDDLALATRCAVGSSIVTVEQGFTRLRGWAGYLGATNLRDGRRTTLPGPMRETIDRLAEIGELGYQSDQGLSEALTVLRHLPPAVRGRRAELPASVLAAGVSASEAWELGGLIDRWGAPRRVW